MADIDKLIDDIESDKLNKNQIITALLSIHGYMAVIEAEGDKESDD